MGPVPEIGKSRREVGATTIGERLITRREKRFVACLAPSEAPVCKGATPGHGALLLTKFLLLLLLLLLLCVGAECGALGATPAAVRVALTVFS
jgi:hypothetical protein